jgi:hypothetical protein
MLLLVNLHILVTMFILFRNAEESEKLPLTGFKRLSSISLLIKWPLEWTKVKEQRPQKIVKACIKFHQTLPEDTSGILSELSGNPSGEAICILSTYLWHYWLPHTVSLSTYIIIFIIIYTSDLHFAVGTSASYSGQFLYSEPQQFKFSWGGPGLITGCIPFG